MKKLLILVGALLAWWPAAWAQAPSVTYVHAPIAWQGQKGEAEFRIAGENAVLTVRLADGTVVPVRMVAEVPDALPILSDPRLAFA